MNHVAQIWCLCFLAAVSSSGCAISRPEMKQAEEVAPSVRREVRRNEVVQDFKARQASAQLAAALARWEQGDEVECERMLKKLLEHDPSNVDVRLRLAEFHWSQNATELAEIQLRAAATAAPDRADVQHTLGALLESSGNTSEGMQRLLRARELEPQNEVYRLAAESALSAYPVQPSQQAQQTKKLRIESRDDLSTRHSQTPPAEVPNPYFAGDGAE